MKQPMVRNGRMLAVVLLAFLIVPEAGAQRGERQKGAPDRPDRIERLKQMELLERLDLGEEDAVRFMARRKDHEERIRALAAERETLINDLEARLREKAPAADIEKGITRALEHDRAMFEERRKYQEEMRKLLPAEKYAAMLVFERDFQARARDAAGRLLKRRSSKFE